MKKISCTLSLILFISLLRAQTVVDDVYYSPHSSKDSSGTTASSKKPRTESKFEMIFQVGRSIPTGAFGKEFTFDSSKDIETSIKNSIEGDAGGFHARSTFTFECGPTFFFNHKPGKPSFGIRTMLLSYSSFPFEWASGGDLIFNTATFDNVRIFSGRIGPVLRLGKKEVLTELYYQAGVAFSSHGGWNYSYYHTESGNVPYVNTNDNASLKLNNGFGIMHELGAHISYHAFKFGISYNFGSIQYDNVEFYRTLAITVRGYTSYGAPQTLVYSYYTDNKFSADAPTNYLKLYIGFCLGY